MALKLDANDADAIVGLALHYKRKVNFEKYFSYLQRALSIDKKNLGALVELSEHYLFKGDNTKAIKLAKYGLEVL